MSNGWYLNYFGEDYFQFDNHNDTALEVDGLIRLIGSPEVKKILDLGCGYGRVSMPLRNRGYTVFGYDISSTLLKRAGQTDPEGIWVRGDMRELPFQGSFEIVINLFNTMGYFENEDENFEVLRSISKALCNGGRFICQLVNRDYLIRHFVPQEVHRKNDSILIEEREFNSIENRVNTKTTIINSTEKREYETSIRIYTVTELDLLLAAAGMTIREIHGGLDFRTYNWDTNQLVLIAERNEQ